MLAPTVLVSERLVLSPLRVDDAAPMLRVLADERMYEFTGGQPPTLAQLRDRYERLVVGQSADGSQLWFNWIIRLAEEAPPIGVLQATVAADGSTADVAWEIGVGWQGRGLAGEAATKVVQWLVDEGVSAIRALVHLDHAASAGVAERAGLVRTTDIEDGEVVWLRPT